MLTIRKKRPCHGGAEIKSDFSQCAREKGQGRKPTSKGGEEPVLEVKEKVLQRRRKEWK